jgi:lipoprotein-anchoring transpeptidase ErfK/SrfK
VPRLTGSRFLASLVAVLALGACAHKPAASASKWETPTPAASAVPTPSAAAPSPTAVPTGKAAPAGLKVIDYGPAPKGFPADPGVTSTAMLSEGLHPDQTVTLYDAVGGTPRAYLAPTLSGVTVVVPIVAKQSGWVAVLLPSVNRTIGWLAPGGWEVVPLTGQVVVRLSSHQLSYYQNGSLQGTWTVAVGAPKSPTPLGRTFVLGRSHLSGSVYAGLDVLALGAVPDDPSAVATGLSGAHMGIHSWYQSSVFGKNISNGCVRVPKDAQQVFLNHLTPGTEVLVLA